MHIFRNARNVRRTCYLLLLVLLGLSALACLLTLPTRADSTTRTIDLSSLNAPLVLDGADGYERYRLTGRTDQSVTVSASLSLVLADVTMTAEAGAPLAIIGDGTRVSITLEGTNTLTATAFRAEGLSVAATAAVVLGETGSGRLTAQGGAFAAGIGEGEVHIVGGIITARGGDYAAGIGGQAEHVCAPITITGGTVTAVGGTAAPGIGSGANQSAMSAVYIRGGSVYPTGGENAERNIDTVYAEHTASEALHSVRLTGFTPGETVLSVALSCGKYGGNMQADENGCFCIWMPNDSVVYRVLTAEKTYLFSPNDANNSITYHYVTSDTVLDVREGIIVVDGQTYTQGEQALQTVSGGILITGMQSAQESLTIRNASVSFYRLQMQGNIFCDENVALHMIQSDVNIKDILLTADTTLTWTGDALTMNDLQAENAAVVLDGATVTLRAMTAEALTVQDGHLTASTSESETETAIAVQTFLQTGGLVGVHGNGVGIGKAGAAITVQGGMLGVYTQTATVRAATLRISGGRVDLQQSEVDVAQYVLTGGSLQTHAMSNKPTDADGVPLLQTKVGGLMADRDVAAVTLRSGKVYGVTGVRADGNRNVYLWLSAEDAVTEVRCGDVVHIGMVAAGTEGVCTPPERLLPWGHDIHIQTYGYTINNVFYEHTGDYRLQGSGDDNVRINSTRSIRLTLQNVDWNGTLQGNDATLDLVLEGNNRITATTGDAVTASQITIRSVNGRGALVIQGGTDGAAIAGTSVVVTQINADVTLTGGNTAPAIEGVFYVLKGGNLTCKNTVAASSCVVQVQGGTALFLPNVSGISTQNTTGAMLVPLVVTGLPRNALVSAVSLADYGVDQTQTSAEGTLTLWAPSGTTLSSLVVAGNTYKCQIAAGETGTAHIYYPIHTYTDAAGNTVYAKVAEAYEGQTIVITVAPGSNCKASGAPTILFDGVAHPTFLQGASYAFVMPAGEVSLFAVFLEIERTIAAGTTETIEEALVIDADQRLIVAGTLEVTGALSCAGHIEVAEGGMLILSSHMTNHGFVQNNGTFVVSAGATAENAGTIVNEGIFRNEGTLSLYFGSTFQNNADYVGDGALTGEGTVRGLGMPTWGVVLLILGGVMLCASVSVGVFLELRRRKRVRLAEEEAEAGSYL